MEFPKFRIELDGPDGRFAKVYINDEDWSDALTGVEVKIGVGELTRVKLEMIAGSIYFDGPAAASIATQVLTAAGMEIEHGDLAHGHDGGQGSEED